MSSPRATPSARGMALRAVILLVIWVGFYLLGVSLAAGLFWIFWAQIEYGSGPDLGGCLAALGSVWILWGLRPRFGRKRDERDAPLSASEHPRLHALVADVARRAGHPVPHELHLLPQANAYAGQRRSFFARGKSSVGIGLPYLAWLDRAGVEAIIAHELGHHLSGDVRLGPWVHSTRNLMGHALEHLEGSGFWLDLPFVGYARAFLRYSMSVSRAQELAADAVSAKVAGAEAAARALHATDERSSAWQVYLRSEVAPMLDGGYLPELLVGFRHFEAAVAKHRERLSGAPPPPQKASQYDTHPTLDERLAALGVRAPRAIAAGTALDLLDGTSAAEEYVLRSLLIDKALPLESLPWEAAGSRLWLPRFRARLEPHLAAFSRLTPEQMPAALTQIDAWSERLRTGLALFSSEASRRHVLAMFGNWLTVYWVDLGFELEALPGWPVRVRRGEVVLEPFDELTALFDEETSATTWAQRCVLARESLGR